MGVTTSTNSASTYKTISFQTVSGSSTNTISFSSISSNYDNLICIFSGSSSTNAILYVYLNDDTSTNYANMRISGSNQGGAVGSGYNTSQSSSLDPTVYSSSLSCITYNFNSYTNPNVYKNWSFESVGGYTGDRVNATINCGAATWRNTNAITKISFVLASGNFTSGSTFGLYGIKAA